MPVITQSQQGLPQEASPRLECNPLEILVLIQCYLDPSDVVSLRKTCKLLASTTKEMTVWRSALRRVLDDHGIFHPTFPILNMSQKELEHAALVPFRFASLLNSEGSIRPFSTRLHTTPNSINPLEDREFTQCFLVPGGRYLFTNSNDNWIDLWDLGYSPNLMIKPFPVASTEILAINSTIIDIQPTPDDVGIQLLLKLNAAQDITLYMYRIYPQNRSPQFNIVNSLKIQPAAQLVSALSKNVFAFQHDVFITVWNFIDNSTATWSVVDEYLSMTIFDGYVLCFDERFSTLWKIPPLLPRLSANEPLGPILPLETPTFIFAHPRRETHERLMNPSNAWPRGKLRPEIFTTFCHNGEASVIDYYALKRTGNKGDDDVPSLMPLHMASSINENIFEMAEPGPARFCHNKLIHPWLADNEVSVHVSEFPEAKVGGELGVIKKLWAPGPEGAIKSFQLCPVSGRFCCVMADGYELRIMDFIVPP